MILSFPNSAIAAALTPATNALSFADAPGLGFPYGCSAVGRSRQSV